jgi:hypothetical protein
LNQCAVKLFSTAQPLNTSTSSEQLQASQVLRIDHADLHFVVVNHDQIVDPMGLE